MYGVSRAPGERAGTASGIGNAARMIGATLGVAIIGGSFALAHGGDLTPLRAGHAGGGMVQLLGALAAFAWIREGAAYARLSRARRRPFLQSRGSVAGTMRGRPTLPVVCAK